MTKACLAIGIEKTQKLGDLPGAVTGARQMADWAREAFDEHDLIELITDDPDDYAPEDGEPPLNEVVGDSGRVPVTIDRVRRKLLKMLPDPDDEDYTGGQINPPDRLILYFAGHGMQAGPSAAWLLSKSYAKTRAIDIGLLLESLEGYGVRQIAVISDACRSPAYERWNRSMTHDGVLPLGPFDPLDLDSETDTDLFQAVHKFDQAYMLREREDAPPRCIFTSVLMEALHGEGENAFNEDGEITSDTIVSYLRQNVNKRAQTYGVRMKPQTRATWLDNDNIYITAAKLETANLSPLAPWPSEAAPEAQGGLIGDLMESFGKNLVGATSLGGQSQSLGDKDAGEAFRTAVAKEAADVEEFEAETDDRLTALRTQMNDTDWVQLETAPEAPLSATIGGEGRPAAVHADKHQGWVLAELAVSPDNAAFVGSLLMPDFETDLTVMTEKGCVATTLRQSDFGRGSGAFSHEVIERMAAGSLDTDQTLDKALDDALEVRHAKHRDPILGVIAAYLYHAVGDIRRIRRMAGFYADREQELPYDIALLARVQSSVEDGKLIAHIPKVGKQTPRTEYESDYAGYFSKREPCDVRVAGRFPIMRNGWFALGRRADTLVAPGLAELAGELTDAPFTTLSREGGERLIEILQGEG